jgi:3-phenylpropionate/trans-cinnamate dioxygenase ferredoxin reductase subunit
MRTVIVGAGQSGAWVARTLRELRPEVEIILIGQEASAPYERPPLSKDVLSGTQDAPPSLLSIEQARDLDINMQLGVEVQAINRRQRSLVLSNGVVLTYDKLVLATGGRARLPELAGIDLPAVHTLRTLDDAKRLRNSLRAGRKLLVLGGGWIGLEVAATARRCGLSVTVIEGGSRLCARSVTPDVSAFLLERHVREGVDVQLNGAVTAISETDGGMLSATTHRDRQAFDLIVVGIGLQPNTALAEACGLEVDNGILVDAHGRTSDPDIYAAGDVTNQPCSWAGAEPGARTRLESWANAQNQGIAVGRALAGIEPGQQDLPWFWSDQYELNLQVLGMPSSDAVTVQRGHNDDGKFCLFQFLDGRLHAVIAVNMPREIKLAKRWMKAGTWPGHLELSDPQFRLDKFKAAMTV